MEATLFEMTETFKNEVNNVKSYLEFLKEYEKSPKFYCPKKVSLIKFELYCSLENLAHLKPHLVKELGDTEVEDMYTTANISEFYEIAYNMGDLQGDYELRLGRHDFIIVLNEDEEDDW